MGGWLGGGDALSTDPRLTPSGRLVVNCLLFCTLQHFPVLSCFCPHMLTNKLGRFWLKLKPVNRTLKNWLNRKTVFFYL